MKDQDYLGDGVYVGHDGYQLWLYANHHEHPTDRIALEPSVLEALIRYAERIKMISVPTKVIEIEPTPATSDTESG